MRLLFAVPLDPDADEARDLIISELSKPPYQAAQPTILERAIQAFSDWLFSLLPSLVEGTGSALAQFLVLAAIIAAVVAGVLIFGLPRLVNRRAAAQQLFGDDDTRDAAEIRRAAEEAAAAANWTLAIAEMYRAIARGLSERTIVTMTPGTTAMTFARQAALAFPSFSEEFMATAQTFDEVRYLGRQGSPEGYNRVAALESQTRSTKPILDLVAV